MKLSLEKDYKFRYQNNENEVFKLVHLDNSHEGYLQHSIEDYNIFYDENLKIQKITVMENKHEIYLEENEEYDCISKAFNNYTREILKNSNINMFY